MEGDPIIAGSGGGAGAAAAAAAAAEKARSRLSRCGACNNCNRRDCGQCVNCVDKPKFGGPGTSPRAASPRLSRAALRSYRRARIVF